MVYLTGDTHGELDRFKHGRLRWLGKRDIVVVLGDFGFVWDGSKEEQKKLDWLRKRPYTSASAAPRAPTRKSGRLDTTGGRRRCPAMRNTPPVRPISKQTAGR